MPPPEDNALVGSHVYFLIKIAMEESIMNIQLVYDPMFSCNYSKQTTNSKEFSHMCKSILIVQILYLRTPFARNFVLQTHLKPIAFLARGRVSRVYVWLATKACISEAIAYF